MIVDRVLIAGQRMADQNGIVALGVERAVSLVGNLQRTEVNPGIKPQRIVCRKAHDQRVRVIRLARTVGAIERGAGLGHKLRPGLIL